MPWRRENTPAAPPSQPPILPLASQFSQDNHFGRKDTDRKKDTRDLTSLSPPPSLHPRPPDRPPPVRGNGRPSHAAGQQSARVLPDLTVKTACALFSPCAPLLAVFFVKAGAIHHSYFFAFLLVGILFARRRRRLSGFRVAKNVDARPPVKTTSQPPVVSSSLLVAFTCTIPSVVVDQKVAKSLRWADVSEFFLSEEILQTPPPHDPGCWRGTMFRAPFGDPSSGSGECSVLVAANPHDSCRRKKGPLSARSPLYLSLSHSRHTQQNDNNKQTTPQTTTTPSPARRRCSMTRLSAARRRQRQRSALASASALSLLPPNRTRSRTRTRICRSRRRRARA